MNYTKSGVTYGTEVLPFSGLVKKSNFWNAETVYRVKLNPQMPKSSCVKGDVKAASNKTMSHTQKGSFQGLKWRRPSTGKFNPLNLQKDITGAREIQPNYFVERIGSGAPSLLGQMSQLELANSTWSWAGRMKSPCRRPLHQRFELHNLYWASPGERDQPPHTPRTILTNCHCHIVIVRISQ